MSGSQKNFYKCYFTAAAEEAANGTDFQTLVAKGRMPKTIEAKNRVEAIAKFLNEFAPKGTDVRFAASKTNRETLEPYIVCDSVSVS